MKKTKKIAEIIEKYPDWVLAERHRDRWKQCIPSGTLLCVSKKHNITVEYAGSGQVHHNPDLYGGTISVQEWVNLMQGSSNVDTNRPPRASAIIQQNKTGERHYIPIIAFEFMTLEKSISLPDCAKEHPYENYITWVMNPQCEPMDISDEEHQDDSTTSEYQWAQGDPEILRHIKEHQRDLVFSQADDQVITSRFFEDGPDNVCKKSSRPYSVQVISQVLNHTQHIAYGHGIEDPGRKNGRSRIALQKHHRDAIWIDHYGVDATTICGICGEHKMNRGGTDCNLGHVVAYAKGGASHQHHNFFYQCVRCNQRGNRNANMFDQIGKLFIHMQFPFSTLITCLVIF